MVVAIGHRAGLFEFLNQALLQQYAPFFTTPVQLHHDCLLYYVSMSECLILFRNDRRTNFLTLFSTCCASYEIVLKGRIKAQSLAQVPSGTAYLSVQSRPLRK